MSAARRAEAEGLRVTGPEAVELVEILHRRAFASGLGLCGVGLLAALVFVPLRPPPLDRLAAAAWILSVGAATAVVALRRREAYGALRRHPAIAAGVGAAFGASTLALGDGAQVLWFAQIVPLCVLAQVGGRPAALAGSVLAGAGFLVLAAAAPPGVERLTLVGSGATMAVLPLLFSGILGRLSRVLLLLAPPGPAAPAPRAVWHHDADADDDAAAHEDDDVGGAAHDDAAAAGPPTLGPGSPGPALLEARHDARGPNGAARRDGTARALTPRQSQVVLLALEGLRTREIAAALGLSARQVERLLAGARRRRGARTTAELLAGHAAAG